MDLPHSTHSALNGVDPKYFNENSRFGGGFYVAEQGGTAVAEVASHGATATHVIRYQVDLSKTKVLDLSDPDIAKTWGYVRNPSQDYTNSRMLSQQAQAQGYEAIRFPSERGSGNNLVIFENVNQVLVPQGVAPSP